MLFTALFRVLLPAVLGVVLLSTMGVLVAPWNPEDKRNRWPGRCEDWHIDRITLQEVLTGRVPPQARAENVGELLRYGLLLVAKCSTASGPAVNESETALRYASMAVAVGCLLFFSATLHGVISFCISELGRVSVLLSLLAVVAAASAFYFLQQWSEIPDPTLRPTCGQ